MASTTFYTDPAREGINEKKEFRPGDKVGILHHGVDTGKRGIVREVTSGQLIVDPEPGEDDNGHPYFDAEELFFVMTKPYKEYSLGDKVEATHRLTRVYNEGPGPEATWEPMPFGKAIHGIYVGYRYKTNGSTLYHDYEASEWQVDSTVLCALVITNPRQNPIPIPFNALKIDSPEED